MSYMEEMSYCPIQEYQAWEDTRLPAESILVDERYMIMMLLAQRVNRHQAVKSPARITSIEDSTEGLHAVGFVFDVPEMRLPTVVGTMQNGLINGGLVLEDGEPVLFHNIRVQRSYFRGMGEEARDPDDQIREALGRSAELLLPVF